ncbi:MAG: hypothetical protein IPG09_14830 [Ignavibacteria bacterium]|nr:hypothetical protein [Ignavibacteria bacterium]
MLSFTVAVYIAVAFLGIYLFTKLFSKNPSKFIIGIIHGSLGLFGIACLIFYVSFSGAESPAISILLFCRSAFCRRWNAYCKNDKEKISFMDSINSYSICSNRNLLPYNLLGKMNTNLIY